MEAGMKYEVKQSSNVPSGATDTEQWFQVIDPLGNVVYGAQYSYMASDRAAQLNRDSKPLLERIAELEAALEANKRSSFIVWDTTIHEMRGKLQSIHSTATHALKKAGGNE
jgi:hypothetical protein